MRPIQKIILAALVASPGALLPLMAQQTYTGKPERDPSMNSTAMQAHTLQRADKLIGTEITDSQGQKVGKVKDIALDLQSGKIAEVIIGSGGVVGIHERYVAVPASTLSYDNTEKTIRLAATTDQVKNAPAFDYSKWEEATASSTVNDSYQRFNAPMVNFGQLEKASKVAGMSVRNEQDQRLGKVDYVVLDLPAGRVAELVLATGGFLGMHEEMSAVPPQAFRLDAANETLTLNTTKEVLQSAPHFNSSKWGDQISNPEGLSSVYGAYNIPWYGSDNMTVRNGERTPTVDRLKSDSAITTEIEQKILATDGLSGDARNIKVSTSRGRVTLRGMVASNTEKEKIGDIAASVVQAANVDNQLEVRVTTSSLNSPQP